jgi:hypothetical protein
VAFLKLSLISLKFLVRNPAREFPQRSTLEAPLPEKRAIGQQKAGPLVERNPVEIVHLGKLPDDY